MIQQSDNKMIWIGGGYSLCIDAIKGLAIFFVLWGHCIQFSSAGCYDYFGDAIFKFIYSFHMPLFALISGYLYYDSLKKRTLKQSIWTRIRGFLWPIILWCTVRFAIGAGFDLMRGETVTLTDWWNNVTGMFLWFLWSILAASIYVAIAVKLLPEMLQIVGVVALYFALYLFPNQEMNLYLYPYFVVGYFAKKTEDRWRPYQKQIMMVCVLLFIALLVFFRNEHYIYNSGITLGASDYGWASQFGIDLYRYAIGFVGSVAAVAFVIWWLMNKMLNMVTKVITDSGKMSMQIYILQGFCLSFAWSKVWIKIVERIGYNPLVTNVSVYWVITFIMAVVFLIVLLSVTKILKRVPKLHKVLFGR